MGLGLGIGQAIGEFKTFIVHRVLAYYSTHTNSFVYRGNVSCHILSLAIVILYIFISNNCFLLLLLEWRPIKLDMLGPLLVCDN